MSVFCTAARRRLSLVPGVAQCHWPGVGRWRRDWRRDYGQPGGGAPQARPLGSSWPRPGALSSPPSSSCCPNGPGTGTSWWRAWPDFHFGHVDRPAVYRALAQLEADSLARASSQSATVGQARRVYQVTPLGERVLRVWMGVIKEEHDYLGQVLRRYQATGTGDAVLAEVEGGWASALRPGWSPVSSTLAGHRRLVPVEAEPVERLSAEARTVGPDPHLEVRYRPPAWGVCGAGLGTSSWSLTAPWS